MGSTNIKINCPLCNKTITEQLHYHENDKEIYAITHNDHCKHVCAYHISSAIIFFCENIETTPSKIIPVFLLPLLSKPL